LHYPRIHELKLKYTKIYNFYFTLAVNLNFPSAIIAYSPPSSISAHLSPNVLMCANTHQFKPTSAGPFGDLADLNFLILLGR
jgi:hypothetical protein